MSMVEIFRSEYDKNEWDYFNNHPNLIGCATRAMIDIYLKNQNPLNTHADDAFFGVIMNRKRSGEILNYAGGDNTKYLNFDKIEALLDFTNRDLGLIIYTLQYIESEIFRIAVKISSEKLEIIHAVILANLIDGGCSDSSTLEISEMVFKMKNFETLWYNSVLLERH